MRIGKGTLILILTLVFVISSAAVITDSLEKREAEAQYEELREKVMEVMTQETEGETQRDVLPEESKHEETPYRNQKQKELLILSCYKYKLYGKMKPEAEHERKCPSKEQ